MKSKSLINRLVAGSKLGLAALAFGAVLKSEPVRAATTNIYNGVTSTNITMNNDTDLTWLYARDFMLTATTNGAAGGTITGPFGWNPELNSVTNVATANAGYRNAGFSSLPAGATLTTNGSAITAVFNMATNYNIAATFVKTYDLNIAVDNANAQPQPSIGTYTLDSGTVTNLWAGPTITNGGTRIRPIGLKRVDK